MCASLSLWANYPDLSESLGKKEDCGNLNWFKKWRRRRRRTRSLREEESQGDKRRGGMNYKQVSVHKGKQGRILYDTLFTARFLHMDPFDSLFRASQM